MTASSASRTVIRRTYRFCDQRIFRGQGFAGRKMHVRAATTCASLGLGRDFLPTCCAQILVVRAFPPKDRAKHPTLHTLFVLFLFLSVIFVEYEVMDVWFQTRMTMPGRLSGVPVNSMPAASRASLTLPKLPPRLGGTSSKASNRAIVAVPTFAASASSLTDQLTAPRAARICLPVIKTLAL